jgi:hypothetical protein
MSSLAFDSDAGDEASTVRPYTVTGGRTRHALEALPFEALIQAVDATRPGLSPEKRRIMEMTAGQYLSVAELSAHLRLPIGVVRVLVGDLSEANLVRVHNAGQQPDYSTNQAPATTLSLLESVLNGISAL